MPRPQIDRGLIVQLELLAGERALLSLSSRRWQLIRLPLLLPRKSSKPRQSV